MKFVQPLTEPQRTRLAQVHKTARTHRERQRAHAVLLSAKGYTLDHLADIFEADRDTVSRWLEAWHTHGFGGLADDPKSGRPAKLDATSRQVIAHAVQTPTPNLKATLLQQLKKGESL